MPLFDFPPKSAARSVAAAARALAGCVLAAGLLTGAAAGQASGGRDFSGEEMLRARQDLTLESFTLDLRLRTDSAQVRHPRADTEFGPTTPSMPLIAGGIIVQLMEEGYMVRVQDVEGETLHNVLVGDPDRTTRLTFASGSDGLVVYADGGEAARFATGPGLRVDVRAGQGYRERFWKGRMDWLDLYDGVVVLGEFDPEAPRLDAASRVLELGDLR